MGERTGISWTDRTFNPWVGCTKVSPGCTNCFAERIVEVFPMNKGKGAFRRLEVTQTWHDPIKWNAAAAAKGVHELVFMGSMLDFFHEGGDQWRDAVWKLVRDTPNLEYQILTKRPERIAQCLPEDWWDDGGYQNVWLGTSVETQKYADLRIPLLLGVVAKVHFLSCEPLLGPLSIGPYLDQSESPGAESVQWVIVGGESGPNFRPMQTECAWEIWNQCNYEGVPFFGKQRSAVKNETPLLINGREWKAFPAGFKRREGAVGQQALPGVA